MRRTIAVICAWLLVLAPIPIIAQTSITAGLSASSTDCSTAASCVLLALGPQASTASVALSGTFSATAQFEASPDGGQSWVAISGPTWSAGAAVSSATAGGGWTFDVAGKTNLRVRLSSYTSGTVVVGTGSSVARANTTSVPLPQALATTATPTFAGTNVTTGHQFNGITSKVFVASDFTTSGVGTALEPITGLSWTLPASTALTVGFHCALTYSQAVGNAAVSFGPGFSVAPTNVEASGIMETNVTTIGALGMTAITTATSSAAVTGTPAATATLMFATLDGFIENPSTTANVVTINAKTATASDLVTVKRGSYCALQF